MLPLRFRFPALSWIPTLRPGCCHWMKHINNGNVYRSIAKNPNTRSSAFTQKLTRIRGDIQYYQNGKNDYVKTEEMLEEEKRKEKKEEKKKKEKKEKKKKEIKVNVI